MTLGSVLRYLGLMITMRRWQQVAEMDPLNPNQRIRILPAWGTSEGAHGAFVWDPVSTAGFKQLADAESQTKAALYWPIAAAIGAAAGIYLGGSWALKHRARR